MTDRELKSLSEHLFVKPLYFSLLFVLVAIPAWFFKDHDFNIEGRRDPASFANASCRELIFRLSHVSLDRPQSIVRPSFGHAENAIADGKHIQFGFESEYTLKEIDGIVTVYGPKAEYGISKEEWLAMPVDDRSNWVRENIKELFPEARVEGGLVRLSDDPELDFLPQALIQDDTGNIEFVLRPFDTFEQWYQSIRRLNATFGEGSMQGTLSVPPDSFFGRLPGLDPDKTIDEKLGLFNFYLDYDILQKLNAGHLRYSSDPSLMVARNFEHPFLGPSTNKKQDIFESTIRGNAEGEKYEADRMERIAGWENSFKYVGGTVYRPDILKEERVVLEIRDAHKNMGLLTDRMLRSLYFMQHGTAGLDPLKTLRHFDPEVDFRKLSAQVRAELERLFPNKANPNYEYDPEIKKSLDVFRNFAYPMRDWSLHLEALGVQTLREQVAEAQAVYKDKLSTIVARLRSGQIDDDEAKRQIHGALAEFSHSSGMAKAFADYEESMILANRSTPIRGDFMREAAVEAGALSSSFPERVWKGPLTERMKFFQEKWSDNISKSENVQLKFKDRNGGSRDIYIISLKDLSEDQKEELMQDYFKAVSDNTVSFPLSPSAGHLYTRIGHQSYDFYFDANVVKNNYRLPSGKRLETFVELDDEEFMRLRVYVENGVNDGRNLIGPSGYQGVTGETAGQLDNNLPIGDAVGQNHNCTSWICTAPIGRTGEALHDLMGAPRSYNVHTNPGWWNMWLANYGNGSKVPFSILFSDESIDSTLSTMIKNNELQWEFSPH